VAFQRKKPAAIGTKAPFPGFIDPALEPVGLCSLLNERRGRIVQDLLWAKARRSKAVEVGVAEPSGGAARDQDHSERAAFDVVAGRAVRSLAYGLAPPRHRRLPRSRSCRGLTYARPPRQVGHDPARGVLIDSFSRAPTEKQILILLAGLYAQRRLAPHSVWRSRNQSHPNSGYDFDTVALLIHDEHGSGRVADLYSRYAFAKAEQLVEDWWQHIEAVAKALLERGTLTGAEVHQAMFDATKTRQSR
jgi:hypothetical protein